MISVTGKKWKENSPNKNLVEVPLLKITPPGTVDCLTQALIVQISLLPVLEGVKLK